MIFDSEGKGLETIYKPYQAEALRFIMAAKHPVGTREVYEAVKTRGIKTQHGDLSRASVINFLKAAAIEGLLDATQKTGKGGHRDLYAKNFNTVDEATLKRTLKARLIACIEEELGA